MTEREPYTFEGRKQWVSAVAIMIGPTILAGAYFSQNATSRDAEVSIMLEHVEDFCDTPPPSFVKTDNNQTLADTRTGQREANGERRPIRPESNEETAKFMELQKHLNSFEHLSSIHSDLTGIEFKIYSDGEIEVDQEQFSLLFEAQFLIAQFQPEPETRSRMACKDELYVNQQLFRGSTVNIYVTADPTVCRYRYELAPRNVDGNGRGDRCYTGRHMGGISHQAAFQPIVEFAHDAGIRFSLPSQILVTPGMIEGRESNTLRSNRMLVHELIHLTNDNVGKPYDLKDTEAVTDAIEELIVAESETLGIDLNRPAIRYVTDLEHIPAIETN